MRAKQSKVTGERKKQVALNKRREKEIEDRVADAYETILKPSLFVSYTWTFPKRAQQSTYVRISQKDTPAPPFARALVTVDGEGQDALTSGGSLNPAASYPPQRDMKQASLARAPHIAGGLPRHRVQYVDVCSVVRSPIGPASRQPPPSSFDAMRKDVSASVDPLRHRGRCEEETKPTKTTTKKQKQKQKKQIKK